MRVPQFPQKRSSALTCVPHEGQNRTFDMGITVDHLFSNTPRENDTTSVFYHNEILPQKHTERHRNGTTAKGTLSSQPPGP